MSVRRTVRSLFVVVAAITAGCAQLHASEGLLASNALASEATEKVFSVNWWARADQTFGLPYRPVEPGEPEVDPQTREVFVATGDGKVRGFDHEGRFLWEYDAGAPFNAGPALSEGRLFVGNAKGLLVALDAASGKKLWEYQAAEELITKPTVADGFVFVISTADTLYAVDEKTGEWRWQYRRDVQGEFSVRGAGRPVVRDGRLFAGFGDGFAVSLDDKDGTLQWAKDLGGGKPFGDVDAGPVLDERGNVYFGSFATGVFAMEAETGKLNWTARRSGVSALAMDPGGNRVYAGGNGAIAAFGTADGSLRWNLALGADRFVSGIALVNGLVLASTGQGPMLFLDSISGALRRTFDPGRGVWAAAGVVGSQAIVLSNRGVVYDLGIEARGRL